MFAPPSRYQLAPSERQVLETVWRQGPIARVDIAKATGLTGASVTRLTRDLEERGLIVDTVLRDGARGQPVRPVSVAREGAYAVGVNFSHSYIDIGIIDLVGELVCHERLPIERATAEIIVDVARQSMKRLAAKRKVPIERIVGAGFSVPGDFRDGVHLHAHAFFPDLGDIDFRRIAAEHMPVPVVVENDAASAALGERVLGLGRGYGSFILAHVGHGIGSGLILDGRLRRGVSGNAGMIGTFYPMDRPRPSGQDLFQTLWAQGIETRDFPDLDALDPELPVLAAWIERAGKQLADGLYVTARVLDPDAILLGGRLPPALLARLFASTDLDAHFGREVGLPRPVFAQSSLGSYAGVIGAAAVCFFRAFFVDH